MLRIYYVPGPVLGSDSNLRKFLLSQNSCSGKRGGEDSGHTDEQSGEVKTVSDGVRGEEMSARAIGQDAGVGFGLHSRCPL